jgi:hypothetical protein
MMGKCKPLEYMVAVLQKFIRRTSYSLPGSLRCIKNSLYRFSNHTYSESFFNAIISHILSGPCAIWATLQVTCS